MSARPIFAAMTAALCVTACTVDPTHTYWRHDSGAGDGQLQRDDARCRNEGMAIAAMNPYAHATTVHRNCMAASGWTMVRSS